MPKETKIVKAFIDDVIKEQQLKGRFQAAKRFTLNLSTSRFKSLVKDKYWNNYPSWSESNPNKRKRLGSAICFAIRELCLYSSEKRDILINHSEGLFLNETIASLTGKDRLRACARGIKSSDTRVRLKAARNLPVSRIKKMLSDRSLSVRNLAIKRIGIDNCSEDLLEDENMLIRYRGIESSDIPPEKLKLLLDRYMTSDESDNELWCLGYIRRALLKKCSDEQLLYFLNLNGVTESEYIKNRLAYSDIYNGESEVPNE